MGKNGPKNKIWLDLLENLHTSQIEDAGCEPDGGILRFFIQKLNLSKLVPKRKYYWNYLNIYARANMKVIRTNMKSIY